MNGHTKLAALAALFACALLALASCKKVPDDREILVVSFGTSYNTARELEIGGVESAVASAFKGCKIARAFTSDTIIRILKKRENLAIDNVDEALERAVNDGIDTLIVQPTHLMSGFEFADLQESLAKYEDKFRKVVLAKPLLADDVDFDEVADAVAARTVEFNDGKTAVCLMGHGTEAAANSVYARMQDVLSSKGLADYYVGTVEAEPGVGDLLAAIQEAGRCSKVVLLPFMVVAGDHANNDMAGDGADSWKSVFQAAGFEVECVLEGLGQNPAIQQIYVRHAKEAAGSLF